MTTEKFPVIFESLYEEIKRRDILQSLTVGVIEPIRSKLCNNLQNYLEYNVKTVIDFKSRSSIESFHNASKKRSEEFIRIIARIIHKLSMDPNTSVTVTSNSMGAFTNLIVDNEVVYEFSEFYPKSYSKLINSLILINETQDHSQIRIILRVLCSVAHWYKDLRWNDEEIISDLEEEAFKLIFDGPCLAEVDYSESEYRRLFNWVKLHENPRKLTNYCPTPPIMKLLMDMYRAVESLPKNLDNMESTYYVSLKSSGLTDRKLSLTVPAVFASQYEICPFGDNELIFGQQDLSSLYNTNPKANEKITSKSGKPLVRFSDRLYGKIVSIPKKGLGRRYIHTSPNFIQDRLLPYHKVMAKVLKANPHDCTFDQAKGFRRSRSWTEYGNRSNATLSLDLSSATDTWHIFNQADTLYDVISTRCSEPNRIVSNWIKLMKYPSLAHGEPKVMKYGQPQGRLSSFPAFALAHHKNILVTLIEMDREGYIAEHDYIDYVVLGDDMCITLPNEYAQIFKDKYIKNMRSANIECNPEKGYTSIGDGEKLSEFAKVLCVDGHFMTPAPWNLLSQSINSFEDMIKFVIWQLSYSDDLDINLVCEQILDMFDTSYSIQSIIQIMSIIVDIRNNSDKYSDNYSRHEYATVLYFYDKWYLTDSIIHSLLLTNSQERLDKSYDSHTLNEEFKKTLSDLSVYYDNTNRKLVDLYDDYTIKKIVRDYLELDITLTSEECQLVSQLFSSYTGKAFDFDNVISNAIDILADIHDSIPEEYTRNRQFEELTRSLRQRSFITEMNTIRSDKLDELLLYLKGGEEDEEFDPFAEFTVSPQYLK